MCLIISLSTVYSLYRNVLLTLIIIPYWSASFKHTPHCQELVWNEHLYEYLPSKNLSTLNNFINSTLQWVIMSAMASQITGVSMVCSAVCSGADQRKHQSSVSLAFVGGIHRWPVNSPHKGPVRRKGFHLITPSWIIISLLTNFLLMDTLWMLSMPTHLISPTDLLCG